MQLRLLDLVISVGRKVETGVCSSSFFFGLLSCLSFSQFFLFYFLFSHLFTYMKRLHMYSLLFFLYILSLTSFCLEGRFGVVCSFPVTVVKKITFLFFSFHHLFTWLNELEMTAMVNGGNSNTVGTISFIKSLSQKAAIHGIVLILGNTFVAIFTKSCSPIC